MSSIQPGGFGYSRSGLQYESNADSVTMSRFFNAVYAWMSVGLALTAVMAFAVAESPSLREWALNRVVLIVSFVVEIGLVWTISGAINRINAATATSLFLLYSAINGFTLSILVMMYTRTSLAGTFVVTAGTFGAMSLYGYTTKRDLTRIGSLLIMALFGIIIASVVNIFFASSILYWACTYIGVLVFVGLTAYDTQRLRMIATQTAGNPQLASRLAIVGSLALYLDFINLFLLLLRLMGDRRN